MTSARYSQVSLDDTPYYHCICRCVRRAFLCGRDHYSGQDYEHRRQWVVDRLALLVEVFAIGLCAYAVMSNHYHLVLKVDRKRALVWTDREVAERWMQLFSGHLLVRRWLAGDTEVAETAKALEIVGEWRSRLFDLGWFMKCLNEYLARRANEEDCCKGRFWESRYKCQALLDERAVLSCMAYVDLNPVRSGIAATPESSDYTSIQQRSRQVSGDKPEQCLKLLPLLTEESLEDDEGQTLCRVKLLDYLQLVDETGRVVRGDKRGVIASNAAHILMRLGIDQQTWLRHMAPRKARMPSAIGSLAKLRQFAEATGRCWVAGQRRACL